MPETFHSPEQVKVFILYLLEKVGYPLEYNDLASIVLRDGYVDYFDFVKYFHDLLENGHICAVSEREGSAEAEDASVLLSAEEADTADGEVRGSTDTPPEADAADGADGTENAGDPGNRDGKPPAYVVTASGRMIARGLSDDLLLAAVREKSYVSAMRHLSLEKRGAVWNHSVEKNGDGYVFHCTIRDCDGLAFSLDLRADSFPQSERMRMNFEDKPDVVYRGIVAMVTGNVNYLFDK
ncbi:MAG: DUF4364 family protein [Clostridia bacterium]|nr:DUF4364 family protein [Clostridia bacterium]